MYQPDVLTFDDLHQLPRRNRANLDELGREQEDVVASVRVRRRLRFPAEIP